MEYTIDYSNIIGKRLDSIRDGLVKLLEKHYSIMGTKELLVEDAGPISHIAIYPKAGKIEAVIPIAGSKRAKFNSSNASGVCFNLNGKDYVIRYEQQVNSAR